MIIRMWTLEQMVSQLQGVADEIYYTFINKPWRDEQRGIHYISHLVKVTGVNGFKQILYWFEILIGTFLADPKHLTKVWGEERCNEVMQGMEYWETKIKELFTDFTLIADAEITEV